MTLVPQALEIRQEDFGISLVVLVAKIGEFASFIL